ncbi:MAG: hypothetical protein JW829_11755 [Pirellulales bacterium]|nr:hypothetical protein [Pirellulales bacterium]
MSENFGCTAIAFLIVCVYSGLRYKDANQSDVPKTLTEQASEMMGNHDRRGSPNQGMHRSHRSGV